MFGYLLELIIKLWRLVKKNFEIWRIWVIFFMKNPSYTEEIIFFRQGFDENSPVKETLLCGYHWKRVWGWKGSQRLTLETSSMTLSPDLTSSTLLDLGILFTPFLQMCCCWQNELGKRCITHRPWAPLGVRTLSYGYWFRLEWTIHFLF